MEKLALFDKNRMLLNKSYSRDCSVPNGHFRAVVHICIFNNEGKMLIQQRAASKRVHANKWDFSVGGCVRAGEYPAQTAERELAEEIGVVHSFKDERPCFSIYFETGFDDYFIIKKDINLSDLSFSDGEVQDACFASEEEILKMIEEEKFINYHKEVILLLFKQNVCRGAVVKFDKNFEDKNDDE